MDFNYNSPEGQQKGGYIIQIPMQGPPPPNPNNMDQFLTNEARIQINNAKIRQAWAETRHAESQLIFQGMKEIRSALDINAITISEGDRGSSDRPPLEPAFDDVNRGKLQNCYLTLCERYVNYVDNFLSKELNLKLTNEIKKDGVQ